MRELSDNTSTALNIESAEESLARLRAILDTVEDAIISIDVHGFIRSSNTAVQRILGYAPDEILGRHISILMSPSQAEQHTQAIQRYLATGERRVIGTSRELPALHKDGSTVLIELSVREIRVGDQRTFTGIVRDLTERELASSRLLEAHATQQQLATELEFSRTDSLRAMELAERAQRVRNQFLANMSHEMRTPLTSIIGYAEELLDLLDEPAQRTAAETIFRNGRQLLSVVSDILQIALIQASSITSTLSDQRPLEFAKKLSDAVREQALDHGLQFKCRISPETPQEARFDGELLSQALLKVLDNAIKFTDSGHVELRISPERLHERTYLRFDVVDTGIGISDELLPTIFQPFAQQDASFTRRHGGTGLGLAIVKQLCDAIQAEISIVSHAGVGTSITIWAPYETAGQPTPCVASREAPVPPASTAPRHMASPIQPVTKSDVPSPLLEGARVLLVEDGLDNQRFISLLLRKQGIDVTLADNGQAGADLGLAAMHYAQPFDLILMDVQMPVMDGYEATRRLRQHGYQGPIIALTAHAMTNDRQRCLEAGCSDYATKPIRRETLLNLLKQHLAPAAATFS